MSLSLTQKYEKKTKQESMSNQRILSSKFNSVSREDNSKLLFISPFFSETQSVLELSIPRKKRHMIME